MITRRRIEEVAAATGFPPDEPIAVPTLSLAELAAGKFTALLQRTVARDAFDAANLPELAPELLNSQEFRLAFVGSIAGGRHDPRQLVPGDPVPDVRAVEQQLLPMLQQRGDELLREPQELRSRLSQVLSGAARRLLTWRPGELRFLDALHDAGRLDAEALHPDPAVQERIRLQPMLQWKAMNVREHRQRT